MLTSNPITREKNDHTSYHLPMKEIDVHTDQIEMSVVRFVQKLGVRPNLTGYHLLIRSIIISLRSPELLTSLTKGLYPIIAEEFGKNVKAVERNIRRAIESAYEYDPERVQSIFYYRIDKPYISEVLSMAVEAIRYEAIKNNISFYC